MMPATSDGPQASSAPAGVTAASPRRSVAVVIVNWNRWQLSLDCLASLRTTTGADWHLYLVDNASSDGSRERLRDLGEDVTVILSEVNGGWAGGNNTGLRAALAAGHEFFFILNNDAQVLPETLASLLATAPAHPGAVLGPIQLDGHGDRIDFVGATIDDATGTPVFMPADTVERSALPATFATSYIQGAGIFVTREQLTAVGLFDDRFYLNFDETDWCFRAKAQGFPLLMIRDAAIMHAGSGSIGGALSPLNVYFVARNGLLFAERHCNIRQRWRHLVETARWAARLTPEVRTRRRIVALLFGRSKLAIAVRRGVADYVLRRFGDCPPGIRTLSGTR